MSSHLVWVLRGEERENNNEGQKGQRTERKRAWNKSSFPNFIFAVVLFLVLYKYIDLFLVILKTINQFLWYLSSNSTVFKSIQKKLFFFLLFLLGAKVFQFLFSIANWTN